MQSNTCRTSVGRLLELRIAGFRTAPEVDQFADAVRAQLVALPPNKTLILVADWRVCPVLTPAVVANVVTMLRRNSPLIERNAVLHGSGQGTSLLQLFRVIQEAQNPHRRLFTDTIALEAWLSEVLDRAEQTRLRQFLLE